MLPDSEYTLKRWLDETVGIHSWIEGRAYFNVPEKDNPTLPFVVFYRVGGSPDGMKQDHPDFIIECWGKNKKEASDVAIAIADEITALEMAPTPIISGVRIVGANVNSGPMQVGGTTKAKRYRLDVTFHMRKV